MDYFQYILLITQLQIIMLSFKPYYKWITFNILKYVEDDLSKAKVLNLIINGLLSIYSVSITSRVYFVLF